MLRKRYRMGCSRLLFKFLGNVDQALPHSVFLGEEYMYVMLFYLAKTSQTVKV